MGSALTMGDRVRQRLSTVMMLVLAAAAGGALALPSAARAAEPCPNESLRSGGLEDPITHEPYPTGLPDCRAYEQVSPVDKNLADAMGAGTAVQSSPSGNGVTFGSLLPFPGVPGAANFLTYLAARGGGEWLIQGLLPESDPGTYTMVGGLTEDLAYTLVAAKGPLLLAPGATPGQKNFYLRDDATGSYRLLAAGPGELYFDGASSDDSHILFEDAGAELIPGVHDATEAPYLYEWDNGQLSLVGVLPDGSAPAGGAVAGPGGPALAPEGRGRMPGGATSHFYTQDTISEDGSRVFFSDVETGQIYVREYDAVTVQVSASQRGVPDPVGTKPAYWRAATPDGRYVFFTSEEKLTDDSTASSGRPDLYRFDVESEALEDLTTGASTGAGVLGTLGVSDDGSYAYFVARAVLASGATEASGQANLYEWHEGVTTFITGLAVNATGYEGSDEADWRDYLVEGESDGPADNGKSSRVTPGGKTVLFFQGGSLDLYSASSGGPTTLASASYLVHTEGEIAIAGRNAFLPRNLSEDGDRVFFETVVNSQMNVYEWEREGEGTCERSSESFSEPTGGCYYLISTGQSSSGSEFGEASANGDNVFFFTRQSLVGQEPDENANLYDARVDGGIAAQNPPAPPAPCTGEACLGAPGSPPVLGAPSTDATFSGSGNLTPTLTPPVLTPATKSLTRAQKLAKALKACKKKPRKKRAACESQARKKYGKKASKSARARGTVGGRHS
jgi:hypothetical protein